MRRLLASILVGCAAAAAVVLPAVPARAAADPNRVLRCIDFEERQLGNDEDLPMHWVKLEGPGLPHYVNGRLSTDQARSGTYSFKYELDGGSLIYRYEPGQIRVVAGAHYRVESYVRTTVLPNARARMTAYLTDVDGRAILSTVRHSDLYAAKADGDPWKKLSVELSADGPGAKSLAIELELLQPAQYAPSSLGARALFPQDIRGSAWWDDVTVSQVPRVVLSTGRPGNIFRRSDERKLRVLVNDKFTDDLSAQLVIAGPAGETVYQRTGALNMAEAEDLGPAGKRLTLDLPALNPGWYSATLVMSSKGAYVGDQSLDLAVLGDDAPKMVPDPRFGVDATGLPFDGWEQLPQILPYLPAGRVKLAVWNEQGNVQQVDSVGFDEVLAKLQSIGVTPTACLTAIPPQLAEKIGGNGWGQLLKADPETWRPELAYMVSRHANHLDRWQFGADADADQFVENPEMRQVYRALYAEFAQLVQKPDLAMPWPAWYDLAGELPATVALSVPSEVLPSQLPLYIADLRGHEGHNLSLSLHVLDDRYGRKTQIRDFAQRVVYALSAGASRIDLPLPFTVRHDGDAVTPQPQEMLVIVRTLVRQLAGSRFVGKVPIGENVEAFLFERDAGAAGGTPEGIIVLWSRGAERSTKPLALNLGERPMRVDLWGNVAPLLAAGSGEDVLLDVGPTPIVLTDVDAVSAQMRASVGFDRPLIESSFQPHVRHLRFANPARVNVGGTLKLTAPKGWMLTPSTFNFSLNPGETFDREVTIEFPYNSFAGPKTVSARFVVQGDRNSTFTVPITLNLGLSDVGMQSLALRDKADLLVQQMITNYGDHPIDYIAFTTYPGQPREERLITNLAPGRTTIKLYRFKNVQFVPGAKVRSSIKEQTGTRILNDEVEIQ